MLRSQFLESKNKYQKGKLKNGMKYILNNNDYHNSISLIMYIRVGSKNENKNIIGGAHFLEHMLFKGSKKYNSNIKLNRRTDEICATHVNASTYKNMTNYYFKIPHQNISDGLELLDELVFNALLDNKEFIKEKDVVMEEINKVKDDSVDYCDDLIEYHLLSKTPLSHFILGSKKDIKEMKRSDMLKFYNEHYIYSNATISISGNLPKNILSLLEKSFKNKRASEKRVIEHIYNPLDIKLKEPKIVVVNRKREQICLAFSFPIFNIYNKKKYDLDILEHILYGNMTSRLWLALRDINPIVYGLKVYNYLYEEIGIFRIRLTFDAHKIEKTFEILSKELKKIKRELVGKRELDLVKNIIVKTLNMEADDNMELAEHYGDMLCLDEEIVNYKNLIQKYNAVSSKDIKNLCNEIMDFNNCLIIQIGEIKKDRITKLYNKYFL